MLTRSLPQILTDAPRLIRINVADAGAQDRASRVARRSACGIGYPCLLFNNSASELAVESWHGGKFLVGAWRSGWSICRYLSDTTEQNGRFCLSHGGIAGRELTRLRRVLTRMVHSCRVLGLDRLAASQATIGELRWVIPATLAVNAPRNLLRSNGRAHIINRQRKKNMNTIMSQEPDGLLTYKQVARRFGIHRRTLERRISSGEFPHPMKIGGCSRFTEDDVVAYMQRLQEQRRGVA